jgi:hypothetical protein
VDNNCLICFSVDSEQLKIFLNIHEYVKEAIIYHTINHIQIIIKIILRASKLIISVMGQLSQFFLKIITI